MTIQERKRKGSSRGDHELPSKVKPEMKNALRKNQI